MIFASWKSKWAPAIFGLAVLGSALASPLIPGSAGGGRLSKPAVHGDYAYVATGVTINTWDLSDLQHPVLASRTTDAQTRAPICGLAIASDHLYVCWSDGYDAGGLSIFSLSDASHPVYAGESDELIGTEIVGGAGHVYLAGNGIGLVSLDVSDPLHPQAVGTGDSFVPPSMRTFKFESNKLLLVGHNTLGEPMSLLYDLADAAHPHAIGLPAQALGGPNSALSDNYLIEAGQALKVFDLRQPERPAVFSISNSFSAAHALVKEEVLTLFGAEGVQTWDLSMPTRPALLRTVPMALGEIEDVIPTPDGFLALTPSGEGIVIDDTTPSVPELDSTFVLPVGVWVPAGAMDDRYGYVAESAFGLRIVDLRTFQDVARVAVGQLDAPGMPGAVDVALEGDRAFVVSAGYGLVVFDVGDRAHPIELGRLTLPSFASRIAISNDRAYLVATNQALNLLVVDVSDVANMRLLGSLSGTWPYDVAARGDHVFLAVEGDMEPAGLRIVDASNPAAPVIVSTYTGCDISLGRAVDVSPDGATTYLGCYDGSLRILDTHDITAPTLIGDYRLPDPFNGVASLEVRGETAYAGHAFGVDEIDISDPRAPALIARHPTSMQVDSLALSPNGSLLAFAFWAGTYYFIDPTLAHARGHGRHARPSALQRTVPASQ
jgi:hypothetical protein